MRQILRPRRNNEQRFQIEGPWNFNDPVHEELCLASLYQQRSALGLDNANFSNLWSDPDLNEYLRGVFWNDDPEVLLFDDDSDDNKNFSSGYTFRDHFNAAENTPSIDYKNLTGRSHFWDMQFIHSMACLNQEAAALTSYRALMWAEFMYKVSIGESVTNCSLPRSTPEQVVLTQLGETNVPANPTNYNPTGTITETIASYFSNPSSVPKSTDTIKFLLMRDDPYRSPNYGSRAIGSVMHLIQDSFARGHARRTLLNPEDLTSATATSMTFKTGTYGKFGDVITFHNYAAQDSNQHEAFDEDTTGGMMDPKKPASFNRIVGGRDSIDNCSKLLAFHAAKTLWDAADGPRQLLQKIFALATNATAADANVNLVPIKTIISTGVGIPQGSIDMRWSQATGSNRDVYAVPRNISWVVPIGDAAWISTATNTEGAKQSYTYRVLLTLPEDAVLSSLILTGGAAADNQLTSIKVNGFVVASPFGSSAGPDFRSFARFSLSGDFFKIGGNKLDFVVRNDGGPTGLIVQFDEPLVVLKL